MRTWRFVVLGLVVLLLLLAAYLLFWPVPLRPYKWSPEPNAGTTGPYVRNDDLAAARLFPPKSAAGPEDAGFDGRGFLYTGLEDGSIWKVDLRTGRGEKWAETGGRPLGMHYHEGRLYVADAEKGLLRVTPAFRGPVVEALVTEVDGKPFRYADSVRVARNGVVWFTSPSQRWPLSKARYDGMESNRTGRLLSHDLATGMTEVRLDDLMFANGVALSAAEDFVLVNEWSGYRIARLFIDGPRKGERDVFYENLPGFPDNIALDPDGFFWVGLVVTRSALLDRLHPHPFLMKILPRIPERLQPQLEPFGFLLGIDSSGQVLHNLQDGTGQVVRVTGARPHGGMLYVTSDFSHTLAALPRPGSPKLGRIATGGPR